MRLGFLLALAAFCASAFANVNVNYRLNALAMEMCDQESRLRMAQFSKACEAVPTELKCEAEMRSKQHVQMLKADMAKYGFPTIARVGNDGAHAAAVVAYHADHDRKFQRAFLKGLEKAMKQGQAHSWDFAYMFDKMRVVSGKAQCFGTHFKLVKNCKVTLTKSESMKSVNRRRAKMGLGTVAEGLEQAQAMVDGGLWHQAEMWSLGHILADNGENMARVWSERQFNALNLP